MSNSETLTETIALRLTPRDKKRLQTLADQEQRDLAELARIIVINHLNTTKTKERNVNA